MVIDNQIGGFKVSKEITQLKFQVYSLLRGKVESDNLYMILISLAFIAYYAKMYLPGSMLNFNPDEVIKDLSDREIAVFLERQLKVLDEQSFNTIMQADINQLKEILLDLEPDGDRFNGDFTPLSVIELSNKILSIKEDDFVLDMCSGYGTYLFSSARQYPKSNFLGQDINADMIILSKIKSLVLQNANENKYRVLVEQKNVLRQNDGISFDKSFMHMPFGMRAFMFGELENIRKEVPLLSNLTKSSSLDWAFMIYQLLALKKDGLGVAIASVGSTFNVVDRKFREYFVNNKHLKAVIALPEKLFPTTSIKTVIYVIGHNYDDVMMIDGSNYFTSERRQNVITHEDIEKIIKAYKQEGNTSKKVTITDIKNNDYVLLPNRYLSNISYKNGVRLGDFATIKRGAPLTAADLDKLSTIENTDNQYLMLSDISEGIISEDLHYITQIESSLEKYLIKEGNLILSKIGSPFKVAVLDKRESNVLANGNLYIIEVDKTKANPYYLQAFLQSEDGQKLLQSISAGVSFSTVGIGDLSNMELPLPDLKEQNLVGDKMKQALMDITKYNRELDKARAMIASMFKFKGGK